MMPEYDPSVEGAIYNLTVNQTFFHNTILKTAITWTLKPGQSQFGGPLWKGLTQHNYRDKLCSVMPC